MIRPTESYEGKGLPLDCTGLKLQDLPLDLSESMQIRECHLEGCELRGNGTRSDFMDVLFEHCDLSNAVLFRSSFRRVRFEKCRLIGCDFSESAMQDFEVIDSAALLSNWNASVMKHAAIRNTQLAEASFSSLKHQKLLLEHCDLTKADFFKTDLNGLDFSSDEIQGIVLDPDHIKGVTVTSVQALMLAGLLGVLIKD